MLNGLKPEQFQKAFEQWASELIGNQTFMASVDGKTMRNVKGENGLALMLVKDGYCGPSGFFMGKDQGPHTQDACKVA